jgi:ABC-type oligopeptide transport system substrate-binding subunit
MTITLTYFRDENAMFEAFKKGLVDVFDRREQRRWASQYDFPGGDARRHRQGDTDQDADCRPACSASC